MASNREKSITTPQADQKSASEDAEVNGCARRRFVLPENASKKKGPALTTGPQIYKAPNYHERTLCNEFSI